MKIGVLQGRLTRPTNGELQCFPTAGWVEEFKKAESIGLECIELLLEKHYNPLNPLYSLEGLQRLKELSLETGVTITSVCADYFMERPLHSQDENCVKESKEMLRELIMACKELSAERIVIPFFENGAVKTEDDLRRLKNVLREVAPLSKENGVEIALELTIPASELFEFMKGVNEESIVLCYDTGNTSGLGFDCAKEILLLRDWIKTVHVKDRKKSDYSNVLLGDGDTDFNSVFEALKEINYQGPLIFETFRGEDPVKTAETHKNFVMERIESA